MKRLLRLEVEGLPHFKEKLDINFTALQRVSNSDQLIKISSKINANPVIALIGVNASGKTTILKTIVFVLEMLNNHSLNDIHYKTILNDLDNDHKVTFTSYFCDENTVAKLKTIIIKSINLIDDSEKLEILDETLWSKNMNKIKTKKELFDFNGNDLAQKRSNNEQYLMNDVSIIIALNDKNKNNFYCRNMLDLTDFNFLGILGEFPSELLTFLDPSIEYMHYEGKNKKNIIHLKFYGYDEIIINNPNLLQGYLSSGTIKGLNVFMNAFFTFQQGGYLIVDELENHFNHEIVSTLLRFFMTPEINVNGSVLVFSTHYSELLDEIDRNDSVYIIRNKNGITAENLSRILKRKDIKKSDIYDSDYLGGTAPSYEAYIKLRKFLVK